MPSSATFDVSPEVTPGKLLPAINFPERFASSLRSPIEALSPLPARMIEVADDHALLSATKHAFYGHYPLRLSPDVIWLTLARNFALHVFDHAEELRGRFVSHQGQEKLSVVRPEFSPGEDNPWEEAFAAFSDLIAERVGKIRSWIQCDFSTTGPVERTVSDLMVMETFEPYFEYEMLCGCGIPKITLLGTPADWKSVRQRAVLFGEFGLECWGSALDPILAQFESAANGNVDRPFWQSMFRYRSGSFGSAMTGWLTCLFPYLQDQHKQRFKSPTLADWQVRMERDQKPQFERFAEPLGYALGYYPACLTNVPLTVHWGATECPMRIVGGLVGVSQDESDGAVQPEAGWALTYGADRSGWNFTSARTIWPMLYQLPDINDFRTIASPPGEVIAEASMETTLLGKCRLMLKAANSREFGAPHLLLEGFCFDVLSDVGGWRERIAKAMKDQIAPHHGPNVTLPELVVEPEITASWIGTQQEITADFKILNEPLKILRVVMSHDRGEQGWIVESVAVKRP